MNPETLIAALTKLVGKNVTANATALVLVQIAVQLAEINGHLAKITDPTKGITASLAATNDVIQVQVRE
jgi:hypothetical protein